MSAVTLHSFMVYAPDYPDAAQRRQQVREQHLANLKGLHGSGALRAHHFHQLYSVLKTINYNGVVILEYGGALLSPDSIETPGAPRKMVGSMVVIQAESLAEARKRVESDIYWTSDVVSLTSDSGCGCGYGYEQC